MFTFTVIAVLLCIATGFNAIAAVISWRRAKTKFGFYFAVGMTSITLWTLASALDYAAVPISLKVFFAKWEYLFYHLAFVYFLLFILSFAGYENLVENKFFRAGLWVICGSNILLAWTNDWHGWLWSGFSPGEFGNNTIIFEHGPAFLWVTGTFYLLFGMLLLLAWLASRRGSQYARRQGRLLFFIFLLPLLGNLVYQFQPHELKGMDWSSVFLSVSSILCVWALYDARLLDIIPIVREKLIESLSDGMIVLDLQGRVIEINQPAAQTFDSAPEKMIERNLDELLPLAQSLSGYPPEQEIRTEIEIGASDKRYFDVLVTPLFEKREAVGRLIVFREMTIRKQNELRLFQFSRAIEQSPTSVVVTDLDGNITYVNPQFSSLTGYTFEEALGQNPRILQSGHTSPETYQEMWRTITSGKVWKGEFLNKKKNGDLYWEHATIASVLDHDGRIINYIAIKADITERKKAEEELQASEEKFATAFRLSADVIAITSIADGLIVEVNDSVKKVLGYTRDEVIGKSTVALNIWVESAQREQFVAALLRDGFIHDWEVQMRAKSGELVDILLSSEIIELQGNKYILGTLRDITARKWTEDVLRANEKRLKLAQVAAHSGVWEYDILSDKLYWSDEYYQVYGITKDTLPTPENWLRCVHPEDRAMAAASHEGALAGAAINVDFRIVRPDGETRWLNSRGQLTYDAEGRAARIIGIATDITERKRMEAELERLATTDSLTGTLNRRELARLAKIELERAHRYEHPTSAIMMDVDYFKEVNDTYGHAAGDRVLVALAQLLTKEVRASDLVARYGGEEFMLILPETAIENAQDIAERIRRTVADTPVIVDDQTIRFTISLGVTSSESVGQDFESLLKEADRLLYQAKQSGRNRVASSPVDESP